jgi:4'-phosphopantetheinyl transferase
VPEIATVHVWEAPLRVDRSVHASLVASLSPDERARAGRYRDPDDARRFAVARGWLRHVLSTETGMAPGQVAFAPEPGKPRLATAGGPHFNLSHAEDLAVIAVAPCEVGVDVEYLGRGLRVLDAASVACTAEEVAALKLLAPVPRAQAFLRLWTAKEAYLKATGLGLTVPPDQVEIGVPGPGGVTPVGMKGDAEPPRWWVRELRFASGHVGAVAAEGREWVVAPRAAQVLAL